MMKHSEKLLEEILEDEPCHGECIAGMLLKTHPMDDYMIMQLKMIEKFKWDWSQSQNKDIGWEVATDRFIKTYAENYRRLWDQGERHVTCMYWSLRKGK